MTTSPKNTRMLITGSNSLLGKALFDTLHASHQLVLAYHTTKPTFARSHPLVPLDITDPEATKQTITQYQPDIVVHLASLSDIDYCQSHPDQATRVNIHGTRNIIHALQNRPTAKLVFVSSSMVFDGKTPARERTTPRPLNHYGYTKYQAEQLMAAMANPYLVIRPTTLYGWPPLAARDNPATWIVKALTKKYEGDSATADQAKIPVVADYFTNPLYAPEAARIIGILFEKNITGTLHFGGRTRVSRFAFAKQVARAFGLNARAIRPARMAEFTPSAPRPHDATLQIQKLERILGQTAQPLRGGLQQMRATPGVD